MIKFLVDLNSACSDYAVASSLNLLYTIFKMICVIVPIILIVFASINMGKLMINPDDKKGIGNIAKKIMAAIIIFIVPNFLDIVVHFNTLSDTTETNFSVLSCLTNSENSSKSIGLAVYNEGAGTEKGTGLSGMFGDLSGLKNYTSSSGSSDVAGEGAQKLINIAKKEIGNNETNKGYLKYMNYYPEDPSEPWCAIFVSWCADQAGFIDSGIIPKYESCSIGVSWFQSKNAFHKEGSGYTPQPGDIVFFGPGGGSHTGIVVSSDANYVHTIEGNYSDSVAEVDRPRTSKIYGYGTPAY